MSKKIFYAPPGAWEGNAIILDETETRHLQVLRLAPGDVIEVLDGAGLVAECRIVREKRREAELEILKRHFEPEGVSRAIIALALSKATRRGFFMEKAVELGAFGVWIWQAENSQGEIPAGFERHARAQMISGAKQCGNPWLPQARVFASLAALLPETADIDYRLLPLERQEGQPMPDAAMLGRKGTTIYMIGPEGGFSDGEIAALLARGFTPLSLGQRVLRCETAAVLCLGLHYWAAQTTGKSTASCESVAE